MSSWRAHHEHYGSGRLQLVTWRLWTCRGYSNRYVTCNSSLMCTRLNQQRQNGWVPAARHTLANTANLWTRCLLFGTRRTYFRGITSVKGRAVSN
jgi:hypothetical protein